MILTLINGQPSVAVVMNAVIDKEDSSDSKHTYGKLTIDRVSTYT
jgi:hypothetical protein